MHVGDNNKKSQEKKKNPREEKGPSNPASHLSLPWCPVVGLPLNLSGDKAAQGIIHLPVPFSISGGLAGTFCPPLKYKMPSVRNSGTYSPLHSLSPLLLFSGKREEKKGMWVVGVERRETQTDSRGEETDREVLWRLSHYYGRKRWAKRGDKTGVGGRKKKKKRKLRGFIVVLPHHGSWQGGPRRELRLIGSFGLEKWISASQKKEKTCFLPNQMTNELLICCLQSRPHNTPLFVCMMDLIMAGSLRFRDGVGLDHVIQSPPELMYDFFSL